MNRKPPVKSSSMLMASFSLLSEEDGREPKTTEENTAAPYLRQSVWLCEVVCAASITFSSRSPLPLEGPCVFPLVVVSLSVVLPTSAQARLW